VLTQDIESAIVFAAETLLAARDPWWIIGGAAFALMSSKAAELNDIDVLVSRRDAKTMSDLFGWSNIADGGNELFRSSWFLKTTHHNITIEFMSDLEVYRNQIWTSVQPQTRQSTPVGGHTIYLPEASDLACLFEAMGRPKDLERARLLR
jgi:hypothetical protein